MKNLTTELLIKHIEDKIFSVKKRQSPDGYFAYCHLSDKINSDCGKCHYSYNCNTCYTVRFSSFTNNFILEHFPEEII